MITRVLRCQLERCYPLTGEPPRKAFCFSRSDLPLEVESVKMRPRLARTDIHIDAAGQKMCDNPTEVGQYADSLEGRAAAETARSSEASDASCRSGADCKYCVSVETARPSAGKVTCAPKSRKSQHTWAFPCQKLKEMRLDMRSQGNLRRRWRSRFGLAPSRGTSRSCHPWAPLATP